MEENFKRKERITKLSGFWDSIKNMWSGNKEVNRRMRRNPGAAGESGSGGTGGRFTFKTPKQIRQERRDIAPFIPNPSSGFERERDKAREIEDTYTYKVTDYDKTGLGENYSDMLSGYKSKYSQLTPNNVKEYWFELSGFMSMVNSNQNFLESLNAVLAMLNAKANDPEFMDMVKAADPNGALSFKRDLQMAITGSMKGVRDSAIYTGVEYSDVAADLRRKSIRANKAIQKW